MPAARRRGYATEVVSALVARAFEHGVVNEVVAHTSDENFVSIQVLLRCRFSRVGPGSEPASVQYRTKKTP